MVALGKVLARGQVTLPREIRRATGVRPGDTVTFRAIGPGTVEIRVLPRMRLADALEMFRIEEPVDEPADREAWQTVAARDVLGK